MKHFTRYLAIGTMAVTLGTLVACASPAQQDGPVELVWWDQTQQSETANALIEQIIDDFEAENPDISVTREGRAIDAHKDALRTAIGTPTMPDIYFSWAGPGLAGEFIDVGASLDLSEYYDEYGWNDRFSEAALAQINQYDGAQGVPWTITGEAVYYRKDLFAQAGIATPPTTYAELVDAAEKLEAIGVDAFAVGGKVNWHLMRILDNLLQTECGPETASALVHGEGNWAEESCVEDAFTELQMWGTQYLNDGFISVTNDESAALLFSGRAAMALEVDSFPRVIGDNDQDLANYGVFQFPTGDTQLYGFVKANYVSSSSKNPDAAAKFLDYLTSTDVQQSILGNFGTQSVNVDVELTATDEISTTWTDLFQNSTGIFINNDQNLSTSETTEYWRIQNLVATGQLDPAEAGPLMQDFLDNE